MESLPNDAEPDGHGLIDEAGLYLPEFALEKRTRKRWRTGGRSMPRAVVVAVAAALVVGGASGYAMGSSLRATPRASMTPEIPGSGVGQYAVPLGRKGSGPLSTQASVPDSYSALFTRHTDGITIRAFLDGGSETVAGATQGCPKGPPLIVEVSTSKMVGVSVDWGAPSSDLYPSNSAVQTDVLGAAEGQPIAVVMVATGPKVHEVSATFSTSGGRSDSMSPVYGWAVLAAAIPSVPSPADAVIGGVLSIGSGRETLTTAPLRANSPVVAWYGYAPSCVLAASPSKLGG